MVQLVDVGGVAVGVYGGETVKAVTELMASLFHALGKAPWSAKEFCDF
jgi:hypothetical protein